MRSTSFNTDKGLQPQKFHERFLILILHERLIQHHVSVNHFLPSLSWHGISLVFILFLSSLGGHGGVGFYLGCMNQKDPPHISLLTLGRRLYLLDCCTRSFSFLARFHGINQGTLVASDEKYNSVIWEVKKVHRIFFYFGFIYSCCFSVSITFLYSKLNTEQIYVSNFFLLISPGLLCEIHLTLPVKHYVLPTHACQN